MENFLSTIAQVTFTIVGLFFVAITSDVESRDFWLGRMPYNRYTYLNFLIMLFPGFMAVTGMVSAELNKFPAWTMAGMIFFFVYFWVYRQFRSLKMHSDYPKISHLEYKLDISTIAFFHSLFLLFIPLSGLLSYISNNSNLLINFEYVLRIYLSLSVVSGVLPAMVFARELSENKYKAQGDTQVDIKSELVIEEAALGSEKKDFSPFILTALFAFIIGWLYRRRD